MGVGSECVIMIQMTGHPCKVEGENILIERPCFDDTPCASDGGTIDAMGTEVRVTFCGRDVSDVNCHLKT